MATELYLPGYAITPRLAASIAEASRLAAEIDLFPVQRAALTALERAALERRVHASVGLEGNPLTEEAVAQLLRQVRSPFTGDAWAREVTNYAAAVRETEGWAAGGGLTESRFLRLHRLVGQGLIRPLGRYRERPLVVRDPDLRTVVYHAPPPPVVPALTRAFLSWLDSKEARGLPWILLGGIVHARIVRIHPFSDGSGRVARLATLLVMRQQGCRFLKQAALEPFYNADRRRYFRALRTLNAGRREPMTQWLDYFAEGVVQTLAGHRASLPFRAVRGVLSRRPGHPLRLRAPQLDLYARLKPDQQVTAAEYAERYGVSLRTAQYHLRALVVGGLLRSRGARKGRDYVRRRHGHG